jgi:tripartite-type tricarboxylate transporter receptor subunit TctC
MPVTLRDRISEDIRQALADDTLVARLAAIGLTVASGNAEEFSRAVVAQRRQVHEIARIIGIRPPSIEGGR